SRIMLEVTGQRGLESFLSFDGDMVVRLKKGDRIEIEKSEMQTTLVQLKQVPFLENIRNKMRQI
ncbi:MAG: NAD(+) kinase, partial [Clostridium sp.]